MQCFNLLFVVDLAWHTALNKAVSATNFRAVPTLSRSPVFSGRMVRLLRGRHLVLRRPRRGGRGASRRWRDCRVGRGQLRRSRAYGRRDPDFSGWVAGLDVFFFETLLRRNFSYRMREASRIRTRRSYGQELCFCAWDCGPGP